MNDDRRRSIRSANNTIPFLSLVITGSLGSLGLLNPPLLTAIMRNVYFMFSARSGTRPSHLFPINSAAFCHLELQRGSTILLNSKIFRAQPKKIIR